MPQINIDESHHDLSTYAGRFHHFFALTNPANALKSRAEVLHARDVVDAYRRAGSANPLTSGLSEAELRAHKVVYDSAIHPDSGEVMLRAGRMSFQVPANMIITGCMMTFYKSTSGVLFWQWINQTFNAGVNYTNRSGSNPISVARISTSYALATTGAISAALFINRQVARLPAVIGRLVPFVAVCAANCINIPCMRSDELSRGIPLCDEQGRILARDTALARSAISQVVASRIFMAMPYMVLPPFLMNALEKRGHLKARPWISAPLQVVLCGLILTVSTPAGCALFPQRKSVSIDTLSQQTRDQIAQSRAALGLDKSGERKPAFLYYNKGL